MKNVPDQLLQRNEAYAQHHEPLAPLPTLNTIVISCVDARIDPAHILGLAPGEAVVLRNAGGRVTDAVLQDIALLIANKWEMTPRLGQGLFTMYGVYFLSLIVVAVIG